MKRTWNVCLTALLSVLLVAGSVPFHAEAQKNRPKATMSTNK